MNVHAMENITVFTTPQLELNIVYLHFSLHIWVLTQKEQYVVNGSVLHFINRRLIVGKSFYPSHPPPSSPIIFIIIVPGLSFTDTFAFSF